MERENGTTGITLAAVLATFGNIYMQFKKKWSLVKDGENGDD